MTPADPPRFSSEPDQEPASDDQADAAASQLNEFVVAATDAGQRLDVVLANGFAQHSRSRLQRWLKAGQIRVDGQSLPAKYKVLGGELIELLADEVPDSVDTDAVRAQPIEFDIVYRDDDLLVINKPAGLVMHPAPGNQDGTVMNGLLALNPALAAVPRAGIVHRLDKDTTGLFVVAQSLRAHTSLVEQLQTRTMGREYAAVVQGELVAGATIDAPIGRHPVDRKRMAVVAGGRTAITHYRVLRHLRGFTYINVKLETGRTHQIRVHLAHLKHALVGDQVYGGRRRLPAGYDPDARETIAAFPRQALHAHTLSLQHPDHGETCRWSVPLPDDIENLLALMEPQ